MRNYSIDTLKFFCAILVVLIHVDAPPIPYVYYYDQLIRCAVPIFFMISGYLLMGDCFGKRIVKTIKKVAIILLWSTLFYAVVLYLFNIRPLSTFLPSFEELYRFLLFNHNPYCWHLWYLAAYIYVLIICLIISRSKLLSYSFVLIPILLVSCLLLGKYSFVISASFPLMYSRNFLFTGFPFFLLGMLFSKYEQRIDIGRILLPFVIISFFVFFIENKFLLHEEYRLIGDIYINTIFISLIFFQLFISFPLKQDNLFSKIGRKDSLYIYILHPFWILFFDYINSYIPITWNKVVYPIVIIICTLIMIYVLRALRIIK